MSGGSFKKGERKTTEGIVSSGAAAKSEPVRSLLAKERGLLDRFVQRDQTSPKLESRRRNPAAEVKLSEEVVKAEPGVQPRQEIETYEALNR